MLLGAVAFMIVSALFLAGSVEEWHEGDVGLLVMLSCFIGEQDSRAAN
jgi:hypothetical protein